MKRLLLLAIINTLSCINIQAQVYHGGDLRLSTQAEIDTFNYTEVEGNLFIQEAVPGSITNLQGLNTLIKISPGVPRQYSPDASLIILENTGLKNLNGLENLKSLKNLYLAANSFENIDALSGISYADEIDIVGNYELININGLSNLNSISSYLGINYNGKLTSIEALSKLNSAPVITINGNPLLINLNGLSNLKTISDILRIGENASLTNIDALSNLTSIGLKSTHGSERGLFIIRNPSLTNVSGLLNVTSVSGTMEISNNAALRSIKGLSNISSTVQALIISRNSLLTNIDSLNRISAGKVLITDNAVLNNIDGLSGLDSITYGDISNNHLLTNVMGLSNLQKAGSLILQNNTVLHNLDGLGNLVYVEHTLEIENNPTLSQFCGLHNLFKKGIVGKYIIRNNAENPSREEIIADCSRTDRSFISMMQLKDGTPGNADNSGGVMFILNNTNDTLRYWISLCNLNGNITAAHFHNAVKDSTGPLVKEITGSFIGNSAQGVWTHKDDQPLTSALINELFGEKIYIDVQTAVIHEGEFRGQITSDTLKLYADLTGDQEVSPVTTNARGKGTFLLSGDGKSLQYHILYENLSSTLTAAHFHKALSGVSGPVVKPISFEGNSSTGIWTSTDEKSLTPQMVAELIGCSDLYVNIHTTNYPEGEIRGQILRKRTSDEFPYMTFWAVSDKWDGKLFYYTLSEVDYFGNVEGDITGFKINSNSKDVEDLAISDGGVLYLINNYLSSTLYKIDQDQFDKDPNTPVETEYIGDTKLPAGALPEEIASLCFINGILYGIGKETKILYSISTLNGSVTKVSELNAGEFRTDGLVMGADSVVYLLKTFIHGPSEIWKFNNFPNGDISMVTVVEGSGKLESLTAHPNGNLYVADEHNLFEINLSDNTIGILDDYSIDIEGMAFNYRAEMLKPAQATRKFRIIGHLTNVFEGSMKPTAYKLDQNFPNPFNPSTLIKYSLPEDAHVKIDVYNSLGEVIRTLVNETKSSGYYQVTFDASGLPSGFYIYRFEAGNFVNSNKMLLIK